MPAYLDTSVAVRYLTNDPPDQAERAQRLIAGSEELRMTDCALAGTRSCRVNGKLSGDLVAIANPLCWRIWIGSSPC